MVLGFHRLVPLIHATFLDLLTLVLELHAVVSELLSLALHLHTKVLDLLTREEPRSHAVKAPPHLRTSRAAFVFDARRTAELVEQNVDRLSAATNGKINAKTANEMRELADRLTQLHAIEYGYGSAKPAIGQALRWIRAIRSAADILAEDRTLAEQLRSTIPSRSRSIAQVLAGLDTHIALFTAHRAQLRSMFPADIDDQLIQVRTRLLDQSKRRERAASARETRRTELRRVELRLGAIVRTARMILNVIKRGMTTNANGEDDA